jgi:hypothetical protein
MSRLSDFSHPNYSIILVCFLSFLIFQSTASCQFNEIIFQKYLNNLTYPEGVQQIFALGDQNQDCFDDFLLWNCSELKSFIFFGGNPVDTIPEFTISSLYPPAAIIDLNDDGIKDLVFYDPPIKKVKIYFGGMSISVEPNIIFGLPPGGTGFGIPAFVLNDFNGDERSELVFFDAYLPYSSGARYYGSFYFYNTGSTFDTIPQYAIFGDSLNQIRLSNNYFSSGDLDGDGLTDFTMRGYQDPGGRYFRRFYKGNSEFNFTQPVVYWKDEHTFNTEYMHITKDLNKDGFDDIIMQDYGFYPYYFYNVILKGGSFPADTIPDFGLNTQNQGIYFNVTQLGDVNGDGFNDFISKTFGPVPNLKLWVGGRRVHEVADKTWYGTDPEGFGMIHGAVGDVNGDGLDDIAIGSVIRYGSGCKDSRIYIFNGDSTVKADTTIVPVEMISFTAVQIDQGIELNWSTATEVNNFGFEVERSSDGINFHIISFVKGHGTTTEIKSYSYLDKLDHKKTKLFYRLRQVDFDGSYEYSDVIEIIYDKPESFRLEQNYPNPFNPSTKITYQVAAPSKVDLKVYNIIGQEVAVLVDELKQTGTYEIIFDASGLSSGIYLCQLKAGEYTEIRKMTVLK